MAWRTYTSASAAGATTTNVPATHRRRYRAADVGPHRRAPTQAAAMTARPPDIVLLMTDQQRYDQIGYATDGPVRTPNLDGLARSGVIFERAYSAAPVCV